MLMSGVPRDDPVTPLTRAWKPGRPKTADTPPPPAPPPTVFKSFHTTSGARRLPASSSVSIVPPMDVTSGSDDGQLFTGIVYRSDRLSWKFVAPWSPEPASTVTL